MIIVYPCEASSDVEDPDGVAGGAVIPSGGQRSGRISERGMPKARKYFRVDSAEISRRPVQWRKTTLLELKPANMAIFA